MNSNRENTQDTKKTRGKERERERKREKPWLLIKSIKSNLKYLNITD